MMMMQVAQENLLELLKKIDGLAKEKEKEIMVSSKK